MFPNTFYPGSLLLVQIMEVTKGLKRKALCHSKRNLGGGKAEDVDEEGVDEGMVDVVAKNRIHSRDLVDRLFACNEVVFQMKEANLLDFKAVLLVGHPICLSFFCYNFIDLPRHIAHTLLIADN